MTPAPAPFVRPLYGPKTGHPSAPGKDVVAVHRALARAGLIPWSPPFPSRYDQKAVDAVEKLQAKHGIEATGNYGHRTHVALSQTPAKDQAGGAFDAYSIQLLHDALGDFQQTPIEKARAAIVNACAFWTLNRDQIAYGQVRPFPLVKPPSLPRVTDCSGYVTTVFYAADAPDPNGGDGYTKRQGYTGTLVVHGVEVNVDDATLGCLVFYGHTAVARPGFPVGSPEHVAQWLPGGYVSSHGSNPGPLKRDVDYRPDLHSIRRYALV